MKAEDKTIQLRVWRSIKTSRQNARMLVNQKHYGKGFFLYFLKGWGGGGLLIKHKRKISRNVPLFYIKVELYDFVLPLSADSRILIVLNKGEIWRDDTKS